MSISRYYFEKLDDLITLLESNPAGKLQVRIGTDGNVDDVPQELLLQIAARNKALGFWLISKMKVKEFELHVGAKDSYFPQGVELNAYFKDKKS